MDQHIISRFYLGNFCDSVTRERPKPFLWVADIHKGTVKRRAPEKINKPAEYYSFRRADGTLDRSIETMLMHIESKATSVIAKIRRGDYELTEKERTSLSLFMASFHTRVPMFRKFADKKAGESSEAMLRTAAAHPEYFRRLIEKTTGKVSEAEVEELRQLALDPKSYSIRVSPEFSLNLIKPMADFIAPTIFAMRWRFLRAPENSCFLTADTPVVWEDPSRPDEGAGLAMPDTLLNFPISPQLCLVGTWIPITRLTDTPHGSPKFGGKSQIALSSGHE